MNDPALFKRLSLLYFAAASFSEVTRRLGRPELARGFLLCADPAFGPEVAACAALASASPRLEAARRALARIDRAIDPFDTAGLLDRRRRDWYPVLATDFRIRSEIERHRGGDSAPARRTGMLPAAPQVVQL